MISLIISLSEYIFNLGFELEVLLLTSKVYPDYFPLNCPPEDATPKALKVYRLIMMENEITDKDLESYYELGKCCNLSNPQCYGVSVNTNFLELLVLWRANPALKNEFGNISGCYTTLESGVIKHTPNRNQKNHHTWWLVKGEKPVKLLSFEKW